MKKYNELQLVDEKDLRESVIGRTEILDKVGELLLLPNTEHATTEQVADYYNVGLEAVGSLIKDNRNEVEGDGYKVLTGNELKSLKDLCQIKSRARQIAIFPKRAILRVGMLLRDSEVAKEVRTRLLDIIHDTQEQSPEIVQGVVNEIDEERHLMLDRVEAEMNGDYGSVCEINAQLFALKNKRITELEVINEKITTNALTISESRAVINRIVRNIAIKEYSGMFGKAWGELYTQVNYKLGINIKNRNKKKNESYINTLTEEETFEVEKIVRNWAVAVGLDLDSLLKIA